MNLKEISYSWFKILSGYYKNNSEKDNSLQTEKSVQFSPKEEKLLNSVRRGKKKKSCLPAALSPGWLAAVCLENEVWPSHRYP